jgi:purine-binding chemotaxis protein CheW
MSTAVEAPATRQLVVFSLAGEDYGIEITRVQEIIRYVRPRPMPGSLPGVEGVINLRGRLIPVVNLRVRLGMEGAAPDDAKVVITDLDGAWAGMVVDEVHEVMTIDLGCTEPPPEGMLGAAHRAIESIAKIDDRILAILDPALLLA